MITTTPSENGQGLHGHGGPLAVGVGVGQELAGGAVVEPAQGHPEVAVGDLGEPVDLHAPLRHLPEVAAQHDAHHPQQRGPDDGAHAERDRAALAPRGR